jgi:tRNA threonylcarbamoyladenosine biosynthesis protein TsaB
VKILGLDTATAATTVALLDGDTGAAVERRDDPPAGERPRHTARLLPLTMAVLEAAGVGWDEVDRIAVGVGPGTFTGLRIGVATAVALAGAREIPIVGVSTLHSLAAGAVGPGHGDEDAVAAVIDARRGEVFAAGWLLADAETASAEPLLAPCAVPVAELGERLMNTGRSWLVAGDGSVAFKAALERSGARIPPQDTERNRVSAVDHCRLALGLAPAPAGGVRPEYLRLPDAEISLRAASQR